ncbi:undecaprenyl-diphosphate phosphatase [Patescibacteria group bacterium]|nr:undecaprenyl-diphosphate phosphatase [Patescibacteria group bacterium]MBU2036173.1 undecaprenyl-diphosphate phosphatase [Patescibacteria group bacterium]
MDYIWSLVLGVLQGFTEFLPISSSGHLVLVQSLIPSFRQPGVLFDVCLHFGTLFAVLFFFRKKLFKLSFKYILYIVVATIPAVIVGYILKDSISSLFSSVGIVGVALVITGLLNFLTSKQKEEEKSLDYKKSLFIGLMQAFAIVPGISRSGSTIFAGTKSGLSSKDAAEFSFLMSVPAIIGANILEVYSNWGESINYITYFIGFLAAFISGVLAIKIVLKFLEDKKFKVFAFYCLVLGIITLLF